MKNTFDKKASSVVKGVAIIMLLFHHCFLTTGRYKGYVVDFFPITQEMMLLIAPYFKVCVGIFAFITGYGITISLKKVDANFNLSSRRFSQLTIKRYLSLMSGYWFIFLLTHFLPFGLAAQRLEKVYGSGIAKYLYILLDFVGVSKLYGTPIFDSTWWYMGLAITIIFAMPILLIVYRKVGIFLFFLLFLIPRNLSLPISNISRWFPIVVLGIICADTGLLDKFKRYLVFHSVVLTKIIKFIILSGLIIICMYYRTDPKTQSFRDLWDGIVPFFYVLFCFEFLTDIPGISHTLCYLGKHSMNIFLIHTFIREYYYTYFIYSFKNAFLIVFILLLCSLALSIIIEWLKKVTRYNTLTKMVIDKAVTIPFP